MGLLRREGVSMTMMIKRGSMWFVKRIGVEIEPVRHREGGECAQVLR